jgi:hypothetical protein
MKKILLGLTTISAGEWRNKVKEIDELGLKEIALFLTCLNPGERKELYGLLAKTKLERIPHVHLRHDMKATELAYLVKRFKTEVFNIHARSDYFLFLNDYRDYLKKIYLENADGTPTESDLKKYAGLCLDLSHWQSVVKEKGSGCWYDLEIKRLASKYKIGLNHISAVKEKKVNYYDRFYKRNFCVYDSHELGDLSELDYVKDYKNYLADIISIELENSLKRQLEVKEYLEKILEL